MGACSFLTSNHPGEEKYVAYYANDAIGHQICPKFKIFHGHCDTEEQKCIENGIDRGVFVWWCQANPLDYYELKVEEVYQKQTRPHADIIQSTYLGGVSEVFENSHIQVGLISDVTDIEIGRVVAEHPCD